MPTTSGAGKSYLAKLEALRSLYAGIEVAVIDPEDEYRLLAETVGGAYVHLGAPGVRVNLKGPTTGACRSSTSIWGTPRRQTAVFGPRRPGSQCYRQG